MRKELTQGINLSDELLASTFAKICAGKQLITTEMAKSGELRWAMKELEQKLVCEKAELIDLHADEVQAMKRDWEEQRNVMLDAMQQEFNDLFQQKRTGSPGASNILINSTGKKGNDSLLEIRDIPRPGSNVNQLPSAYAGIDKELRETEALVRGLLGNTD